MRDKMVVFMVLVVLGARGFLFGQETGKRLTIAAYNVEHFMDVFDDPYAIDEDRPPKPREQIEAIARAVRVMNPDVMAFEELENEGVLRAFVHEALGDASYQYVASLPSNSDRGTNLGVISRLPIVSMTSHRFMDLSLPGEARTWRFARDLFHVRVQVTPTQTLDLFVVHLKSRHDGQGDPKSAKWRLAEAAAAKHIVGSLLAKDPGAYVAMVGDFNDTPETETIRMLCAPGGNNVPGLVDAHKHLTEEQRITYLQPPYRSTIDYILVSPALARRLVLNSARVLSQSDLVAGSDHAPIVASFDLGK